MEDGGASSHFSEVRDTVVSVSSLITAGVLIVELMVLIPPRALKEKHPASI
jgi:hypothetical protein